MAASQRGGDRMTAVDAAFYYLERTGQLLHVASVATLEGRLDYETLVNDLASRLHLIPRYTQVATPVPLNLGHPTWEPSPSFDVRNHVFRHTMRAPGDDEQLTRLASRLFAEPLDRRKPLWEVHLVDGYQGDRSALVSKVHHAMIDGVSGVHLMEVMFDISPKPAPRPEAPPAEKVGPLPTTLARLWRAAEDGVWQTVSQARAFAGLLRRPSDALAELRSAVDALGEGLRIAFSPVPATPFNGHVSTLRRIVWTTVDLRETKAIKNRLGGTVNDVVLTVISAALRRYLEAHGHDPDRVELRAMCPVNVRASEEHLHLGNRISMLVAPLPVGIFDPLERMRQVRAAMSQIKKSGESSKMTKMLDLLNLVPAALQGPLGSIPVAAAPLNTVCTNVPGPPVSLYVQGQRIETLVPMVPLAQGIGLAFAIMSYADTLTIGVTFDPALIRDGATISELLEESFDELRTLAGVERAERKSPVLPERRRRLRTPPSQVA